jgi:hypothetical protein
MSCFKVTLPPFRRRERILRLTAGELLVPAAGEDSGASRAACPHAPLAFASRPARRVLHLCDRLLAHSSAHPRNHRPAAALAGCAPVRRALAVGHLRGRRQHPGWICRLEHWPQGRRTCPQTQGPGPAARSRAPVGARQSVSLRFSSCSAAASRAAFAFCARRRRARHPAAAVPHRLWSGPRPPLFGGRVAWRNLWPPRDPRMGPGAGQVVHSDRCRLCRALRRRGCCLPRQGPPPDKVPFRRQFSRRFN